MSPEATPWFHAELDPPSSSQVVFVGGQQPQVRLHIQIKGYRYHQNLADPVEMFVLVDISGTTLSPGKLTADRTDKRGYFTDKVRAKIWIEHAPEFVVRKQAPDSSSESGSTSSSLSYTVSAGFFGPTATGSAGATMSTSSSQSLPDFEVLSHTDDNQELLDHSYELRVISGGTYRFPTDAVDTSSVGSIRHLNARAVSNLPLLSSVLFHSTTPVTGKRRLGVELTHRVMMVEKTWEFHVMTGDLPHYNQSRDNEKQIFYMDNIKVETTPNINTYRWFFNLDFDNGKATLDG